jgi:hypothetical protein
MDESLIAAVGTEGSPGLRIETATHSAFQTPANCLAVAGHGPTQAAVPTPAQARCLTFKCGKQSPKKISLLRQLRLSNTDCLLHNASDFCSLMPVVDLPQKKLRSSKQVTF